MAPFDLFRDIAPKSMLDQWSPDFRSPKSIAIVWEQTQGESTKTRPPSTLTLEVIGLVATVTSSEMVIARVVLHMPHTRVFTALVRLPMPALPTSACLVSLLGRMSSLGRMGLLSMDKAGRVSFIRT